MQTIVLFLNSFVPFVQYVTKLPGQEIKIKAIYRSGKMRVGLDQ